MSGEDSEPSHEDTPRGAEEPGAGIGDITRMMEMFLRDRQRLEAELVEERRRREHAVDVRVQQMHDEMAVLRDLVSGREDRAAATARSLESSVKLSKLPEADDIEAYLMTFERLMRAYEVNETRWALKLAPQLTGKAQLAYAAMDTSQAGDYAALKAAILRRYEITEETYRQRFRSTRRKDGEMQAELVIRLSDAAKKWTKACDSVDALLDMVILEQFLDTLQPEVRTWVKERKPKSSTEAGRLADDYAQARKQSTLGPRRADGTKAAEPKRSHNCGMSGHFARDCRKPKAPRTEHPGSPGTSGGAVNPPPPASTDPPNDTQEQRSQVKCYNCGQRGHISRRCPSNSALLCQTASDRPGVKRPVRSGVSRRGLVGGRAVDDIILDTGCSQTLVQSDLLPDDKLLGGEAVTIRCAHGDTVLYPLAKVTLEVDGFPLLVEAAVSETLPVSVLLGTDVPELGSLLGLEGAAGSATSEADALVVTTRAQARRQAVVEEAQ